MKTFAEPACVIVKHANPCGVAIAATPLDAYRARSPPIPTSAFGGIIAFNRPVDAATLEAVAAQFLEVLIAPAYTDDALAAIAQQGERARARGAAARKADARNAFDLKRVGGGFLVQSADDAQRRARPSCKVVTQAARRRRRSSPICCSRGASPSSSSRTRSSTARDGRTLGIGAGQMSRVDSTRIAAIKAANAGLSLAGSVVASDAFFPFRDGLDVVADNGAVGRDPAGRQHARRRGDRRGRRARHRDGVHRHPPFPALMPRDLARARRRAATA